MAHFKHSLVLLVVVNITTLVLLLMQLHGLILIWKIHEAKRNNAILAILLRKRSYFHRKMKQRKMRYLNRRQRIAAGLNLVVQPCGGRTFGME